MTPFNLFIFGVSFGIFPLVLTFLASMIGKLLDTPVHEGYVVDYYILWINVGKILYSMFVSGMLLMITIPVGLLISLAAIVWHLGSLMI